MESICKVVDISNAPILVPVDRENNFDEIEKKYKLYLSGYLKCNKIEGAIIINKYNEMNRMKRGFSTCLY